LRFTYRLLQELGVFDGEQAEGLPVAEMLSGSKKPDIRAKVLGSDRLYGPKPAGEQKGVGKEAKVGIPMLNNMLGLQGSEAMAVLRVKELIRKA